MAFEKSCDKIRLMDAEDKQMLQNALALAEENNKMLHKIRGVQKRGTLWQVLKFSIIIGIAFGSFYYLEPYLNKIVNLYDSVAGVEQKPNNDSAIQDFFKKL